MPILLLWLPNPVPIFGDKGFLSDLQSVLAILGGFYIAALTLVTSDSNPLLGEQVGGPKPPTLPSDDRPLSRRRFLAYLFGYLSFLSFSLLAIFVIADALATALETVPKGPAGDLPLILFCAFVGATLTHLVVTSMLGLMYFTERLQVRPLIAKPSSIITKDNGAELSNKQTDLVK